MIFAGDQILKLTVNKAKCYQTCDASDNKYQYAILKNKTSN